MCDGNDLQSSNSSTLLSSLKFCNTYPICILTVVFLVPLILESRALKCVLQLALPPSFAQHNINKRRATSPEARSSETSERKLHRVAVRIFRAIWQGLCGRQVQEEYRPKVSNMCNWTVNLSDVLRA